MKTFKQLSFSAQIRWRIRGLWGVLFAMIVYMILVGELGLGDSRIMSTLADDVCRTIFFGGMIWVVLKIIRYQKLLKNPELLKAKSLAEKDERNRYLHLHSGGVVWDILFVCLLFVTLTTSLMNMPAFYTSFTILLLSLALKVIAYLWVSRGV